MREASKRLHMAFTTFKRKAKKLNIYNPNQGLKGERKKSGRKILLEDIITGKVPYRNTNKLKQRLIDSNYLKDECVICGFNEKRHLLDKYSVCELHHIDGNHNNNKLNNLEILCPNHHALTFNFRFCKHKK
jgi:hypothetical protein